MTGGIGPSAGSRWRVVLPVLYTVTVFWGTLGPAPAAEVATMGRSFADARSVIVTDQGSPADARQRASDDPVGLGIDAEALANVLLFTPFSMLFALRWPRRPLLSLPSGVALALTIEGSQLWLVDHRSPQWEDVAWNSVGVLFGFLAWSLAVVVLRLAPGSRRVQRENRPGSGGGSEETAAGR